MDVGKKTNVIYDCTIFGFFANELAALLVNISATLQRFCVAKEVRTGFEPTIDIHRIKK
jgi:hypothetical protein